MILIFLSSSVCVTGPSMIVTFAFLNLKRLGDQMAHFPAGNIADDTHIVNRSPGCPASDQARVS